MGFGALVAGLGGAAAIAAAIMADRHLKHAPPAAATAAERHVKLQEFSDQIREKMFPNVAEITAEELQARRNDPSRRIVVVDVREPDEVAVSTIGPNVVTKEEFEANSERYRGHEVIAMCTAGYRSAQFAQRIMADTEQRGLGPVFNLRGGILAHTHAGLPLIDPATGQPTNKVHVFAPRWALHGDDYVPVTHKQPLLELVMAPLRKVLRPHRS